MSAFESYPRVTPFLWFDANAEEAVDFYVGIFRNSRRVDSVLSEGRVITIGFELDGVSFTALNGGPGHSFTDAISLVVRCDNQDEVDYYYAKLSEGGAEIQCGWVKDKFGLAWQIVPSRALELIKNPKAMQAMMGMKKLDIAALEAAARS